MRALPQNRLNERIIKAWRISGLIGTVITGVILTVIAVIVTASTDLSPFLVWGPTVGIVALMLILEGIVLPKIRYIRWRYEVTTTEVDIMYGIIIKHRIIIPLVRVQHVETTRGPVLSSLHLASVNISTAGSSFEIPGLEDEEAEQLRDQVSVLARIAQEDV